MSQGAAPAEWPPVSYEMPVAGRPLQAVPTTQEVQAASEGVLIDEEGTLEFLGKRFRLAERIGLMPLLAFANASKQGLDSEDLEGMASMYALIRDVVDQTRAQRRDPETDKPLFDEAGVPEWDGPSEWQRFEKHAIDEQADGEELMDFISRAMAVVSARPRKRREVSSATSPQTSAKSRDVSSLPDIPQAEGLVSVSTLGR